MQSRWDKNQGALRECRRHGIFVAHPVRRMFQAPSGVASCHDAAPHGATGECDDAILQRCRAYGAGAPGCPYHQPRSQRAQAIETGGMIRPLRIAEVGRAIGERVGSHRRPDGLGKIRAGFYHDNPAARPVDAEPELIRPHSEAGVVGLDQRLPKRGRTSSNRRTPARGARQVIDSCGVVTVECTQINGRSVSLEINPAQVSPTWRTGDVGRLEWPHFM